MRGQNEQLAEAQRQHWQGTYQAHPGMYGRQPSAAAQHAATVLRALGAHSVLELGTGHGRDALYFAHQGFSVGATDFSATALAQLRAQADADGLCEQVTTVEQDACKPLPLRDASVHAVFAVHFLPRHLVDALADGWNLTEVHPFEEGDLPRRLWRVTQTLPN